MAKLSNCSVPNESLNSAIFLKIKEKSLSFFDTLTRKLFSSIISFMPDLTARAFCLLATNAKRGEK